MAKSRTVYESLENTGKIEVKKRKIQKLFRELPPEKKQFADGLIYQFAVTTVTLERFVEEINRGELIEDFVQGAQRLRRENPALKSYNATIKSFTALSKSLLDLLPEKTQKQAGEELLSFATKPPGTVCRAVPQTVAGHNRRAAGAGIISKSLRSGPFRFSETGFQQYRETMFLVGRKNGKSTLLSGIALYMLIADYEGAAEIYSVATKKDQAKKVLTEAVNMVKQSPELRAVLKKRRNDLYFTATASIFEALASDSNTLDGLNSHAVIIDELHAIKDRNLYEVMKQFTSSRRQPLVVMITTAGTVRESVFDEIYRFACEIADGDKKDNTFLPVLYELDSRDEWTDPAKWEKANPGLRTIKQYKTLATFVERAKIKPDDLPGVLCKDFNVREVSADIWLSFDAIQSDLRFEMRDVFNTYALGGCDLSATTDLTCATLLIRKPGDPIVYVLQQYFLPEKRVERLEDKNTHEAPYRTWANNGLLTICAGNRVNYSDVTAWFCQMRDEWKIDAIKIGYDRALAGYWVDEMTANGFDMEAVAQGPYTWSQPMREMGAALEAKQVNYNGNPILLWCLTNTAVKKSGLNNIPFGAPEADAKMYQTD